ncbi:trans-sulfuration enzyme family protein [Natronocalculus amylovorans]|uniref:PLP-dependent aspartate aminotransferase family protein n=1 Tax=Natronocalculus amylovorans TaxID=2917812 RepID=A0AAE3FYK8_9EURY|nr:PLP-dependent aspartate aminotransferase family protein [Natronocalculus amylovorans]MCL9817265.1 PLP-dependent aspartate aminotransferase family protein [Natronocalculus amylovorans]
MTKRQFATNGVHSGEGEHDAHGALVTPIYANVTYRYDSPTEMKSEYRYSRMKEPTRESLNAVVSDLHNGEYARTFASGMAAINTLFTTALSADSHVVAGQTLYAESHTLLTRVFSDFGVDVTFVDTTDTENVANAIEENTDLIYLESPTNPMLQITDIAAVAAIADEHDVLMGVDNTFSSPALQRPLDLGVDVVVESLTKYVSGHSDAIAGAIVTNDKALDAEFEVIQYNQGATLGPHDAFLARRGAKTLGARMEKHCENARAVAQFLDEHDAVDRVYYPGLASHTNHEVAAEQMADFGGMVSVELDATLEETIAVLEALEVFQLAESLGGVESLVEQPAVMTHQDLSVEERDKAGIADSLIRFSIGIEGTEDLLHDLEQALAAGCN